jgi:hypothetical protein
MADDLSDRGPNDRKRISLDEEWEVRYWTRTLDVTEDRLRQVIAEVGNMAKDVRAFLAPRGTPE